MPVDITIGQCRIRINVFIGMSLPIGIQRNDIRCIEFPLTPNRGRGIIVLQVVGPDIHPGVMSARAIDALPVDTAVGIEFYLRCKLIGQMLRHLPVRMPVGRFIT